jgi:hypothetical protein
VYLGALGKQMIRKAIRSALAALWLLLPSLAAAAAPHRQDAIDQRSFWTPSVSTANCFTSRALRLTARTSGDVGRSQEPQGLSP